MTIELHDGVNDDGLFDILGKAFAAQNVLNTARRTTVPDSVLDAIARFKLLTSPTVDQEQSITAIPSAITSFQQGGSGLASSLQQYAQQFLIATVNADVPLASKTLANALKELIRQMLANSQSVDASAVTVAATAGTNNGDGVLLVSKKRGDGLVQEYTLAETLTAKVSSDSSPATAGISITSPAAAGGDLSQDWPAGSGVSTSISAVDAANNLLANSDFEDEDDLAGAPDDWILSTATVGTTLKMTVPEVQTVTISGTPTSGYYLLHFTNRDGKIQTSGQIAYNASAATIQAALRLIDGLGAVTVSSTGTDPNYTHSITFAGYGGDITQLTSTNRFNTGSIAHATTTAGTAQVYQGGKALWLASNGSELTTIYQRATGLRPETPYAVSLWAIADASIAAGALKLELVDGIGGSVINDSQGVANVLTINATSLTTSWQHLQSIVSGECVFRLPAIVPPLVYFRLRISTAVTNGRSIFLDHLSMAPMQAVYAGGPYLAAFSGRTPFKNADSWSVAVTNDRAGLLGEMCNRNFGLNSLGLLLPSNSAGSETIPDTVVS